MAALSAESGFERPIWIFPVNPSGNPFAKTSIIVTPDPESHVGEGLYLQCFRLGDSDCAMCTFSKACRTLRQ